MLFRPGEPVLRPREGDTMDAAVPGAYFAFGLGMRWTGGAPPRAPLMGLPPVAGDEPCWPGLRLFGFVFATSNPSFPGLQPGRRCRSRPQAGCAAAAPGTASRSSENGGYSSVSSTRYALTRVLHARTPLTKPYIPAG